MNAVVFTWLTKIGPTFIESENNLLKSRVSNQDEMKTRKEKIIAELDGYVKQSEEFYTFGDYSEITRYYKTWQKLTGRLDSINERILGYNKDEELIGLAFL